MASNLLFGRYEELDDSNRQDDLQNLGIGAGFGRGHPV